MKPARWTGDVIIRFSNFSNDGLKLDTCIVLAHDFKILGPITKLSGHFEDGKLQVSLKFTYYFYSTKNIKWIINKIFVEFRENLLLHSTQ